MTTMSATAHPSAGRPPTLFLVRHGEFPSNPLGLLDTLPPGQRLNDTGIAQTTGAALRLAAFGCTAPEVLHSAAARAGHTAELLAAGLAEAAALGAAPRAIPTRELPDMTEVRAGVLEMRGDAEALAAYRGVTHAWMRGEDLDGRVEGAEDGHAVRARAFTQIAQVKTEFLDRGSDAVLVAHGTLNRVVSAMLGAVTGDWARLNPLPNCGIVQLVPEGAGELAGAASWRCLDWADSPEWRRQLR